MQALRRRAANSFRVSQTDNRHDLLFAAGVPRARTKATMNPANKFAGSISMPQKADIKNSVELQKAIRKRAAELYWRSGATAGQDVDNWRRAEAEILREIAGHFPYPAIVVNVEGVVYTGEYDLAAADGYLPGEWKAGDRVPIRLEGERLFLRRPNGRILETTIIKRIG
jgi:hypothetical protein